MFGTMMVNLKISCKHLIAEINWIKQSNKIGPDHELAQSHNK